MTLSEVLLWKELRNKNILGCDFDRQRPIGNFIVDFYCKDLSLAIEIDGDTHIYKYDLNQQPTPDPSWEGNPEEIDLTAKRQPDTDPCWEGNLDRKFSQSKK